MPINQRGKLSDLIFISFPRLLCSWVQYLQWYFQLLASISSIMISQHGLYGYTTSATSGLHFTAL